MVHTSVQAALQQQQKQALQRRQGSSGLRVQQEALRSGRSVAQIQQAKSLSKLRGQIPVKVKATPEEVEKQAELEEYRSAIGKFDKIRRGKSFVLFGASQSLIDKVQILVDAQRKGLFQGTPDEATLIRLGIPLEAIESATQVANQRRTFTQATTVRQVGTDAETGKVIFENIKTNEQFVRGSGGSLVKVGSRVEEARIIPSVTLGGETTQPSGGFTGQEGLSGVGGFGGFNLGGSGRNLSPDQPSEVSGQPLQIQPGKGRTTFRERVTTLRLDSTFFVPTVGYQLGRAINTADEFISFPITDKARREKEKEEKLAEQGEIGGFNFLDTVTPIEQRGTIGDKRRTIVSVEKLTDEDLKALKFGGGLSLLGERRATVATQKLKEIARKLIANETPAFQSKLEARTRFLERQIATGSISTADANVNLSSFRDELTEELKDKVRKQIAPTQKGFNEEIEQELEEASKNKMIARQIALFPTTAGVGLALGTLSTTSKVASVGFQVFGTAQAVKAFPTIKTAIIERDIQTLGGLGIQTVAFGAGGLAGAKIGNKLIAEPKIIAAINKATTKPKIIAENLEVLAKFEFSNEVRGELMAASQRGLTIRAVQTRIDTSKLTPAQAKLVPDVRGNFIEILATDGSIVQVISLGDVMANLKGKKFSRRVISEATGKLNADKTGVDLIAKTQVGKLKGSKFKLVEEVITLQETSLIKSQKIGRDARLSTSESIISEIPQSKFPSVKERVGGIIVNKKINLDFGLEQAIKLSKKVAKRKTITKSSTLDSLTSFDARISSQALDTLSGFTKFTSTSAVRRSISSTRGITKNIDAPIVPKSGGKVAKSNGKSRNSRQPKVSNYLVGRPPKQSKPFVDKPSAPSAKEFPTMVGGQGAFSLFSGKTFRVRGLDTLTSSGKLNLNTLVQPAVPQFITGRFAKGIAMGSLPKGRTFLGELSGLKYGLKTNVRLRDNQIDSLGLKSELDVKQSTLNIQNLSASMNLKTFSDTAVATKISFDQAQSPKLDTKLKLRTNLKSNLRSPGFNFDFFAPTKLKVPILLRVKKEKPINLFQPQRKQKPYDLWIRVKGKQRKFADNVTRQQALNAGAYFTDNTLSAEFKIRKSKGKLKPNPYNIPKNYWNFNQQKFRTFRRRKNKKVPLKNTFIELDTLRLDTAGESNKITATRLANRRRKPKRRSNNNISKGIRNVFGI